MDSSTPDIQAELNTRHRATARTVLGLIVGVVLLAVLAFVSQKFLTARSNPPLEMAILVTIAILGFGGIVLRRTKFARMRLADVGGLKGAHGLLITLQRTTLQVAFIQFAVAIIGFIGTLITGEASYTYRAGLVAIAVLLYAYPVKNSWQKALKQFSPSTNA